MKQWNAFLLEELSDNWIQLRERVPDEIIACSNGRGKLKEFKSTLFTNMQFLQSRWHRCFNYFCSSQIPLYIFNNFCSQNVGKDLVLIKSNEKVDFKTWFLFRLIQFLCDIFSLLQFLTLIHSRIGTALSWTPTLHDKKTRRRVAIKKISEPKFLTT